MVCRGEPLRDFLDIDVHILTQSCCPELVWTEFFAHPGYTARGWAGTNNSVIHNDNPDLLLLLMNGAHSVAPTHSIENVASSFKSRALENLPRIFESTGGYTR